MRFLCLGLGFLWCSISLFFAAETIYTPPLSGKNNPAVAAPRDDWYADVQKKFDLFGNKHADIVFDGDSITNRWQSTGRQVWNQLYAGHAADFGIEGDRVENVLWRLSKGQVDGVDPKVVVLMIGTNNTSRNTPDEIADGIKTLVGEYEKRCANAHIILMAVFPRAANPGDGARKAVAAINAKISLLDDGTRVSFVDIGPKLVESDQTISASMMPDFLHPTAQGYRIWADAIEPIIQKYVSQSAPSSPQETAHPSQASPPDSTPAGPRAVITFDGLFSGANALNSQDVIPASYQPLAAASPHTGPPDGGNLNITVTWNNAEASNQQFNSAVHDHTPGESGGTGGVMFGTSPFDMTFSQTVRIPSLFWTYYGPISNEIAPGTIAVYSRQDDASPAKSITLHYGEATGYVWQEATDFAGIPIQRIVFTPGTDVSGSSFPLNIDDITVEKDGP